MALLEKTQLWQYFHNPLTNHAVTPTPLKNVDENNELYGTIRKYTDNFRLKVMYKPE